MTPPKVERVASNDGTGIGCVVLGTGPAVVIVHGSLTTGTEWLPVATALSDRFTCVLMDRRGRGRSEDAERYSLTAEREDIEAVLDYAGGDAHLLGHSYGAICALEVARTRPVSKLVLYEPPLPVRARSMDSALADFKAAVERQDYDEALTIGCRRMMRMSDDEIAALRGTFAWRSMAALTPTWVRECEVMDQLEPGVARYAAISAPTLLLLGTATAAHHVDASRALEQALEDVRVLEVAGEGHRAHLTATRRFARAVSDFLTGSS